MQQRVTVNYSDQRSVQMLWCITEMKSQEKQKQIDGFLLASNNVDYSINSPLGNKNISMRKIVVCVNDDMVGLKNLSLMTKVSSKLILFRTRYQFSV
jgi:hypothetical protein